MDIKNLEQARDLIDQFIQLEKVRNIFYEIKDEFQKRLKEMGYLEPAIYQIVWEQYNDVDDKDLLLTILIDPGSGRKPMTEDDMYYLEEDLKIKNLFRVKFPEFVHIELYNMASKLTSNPF